MASNFLPDIDNFFAKAPVNTSSQDEPDFVSSLTQSPVNGNASNFIGTPGLPGASGNLNPGSIVSNSTFGPLTEDQFYSADSTANGNVLSNAAAGISNSLFGTNFNTSSNETPDLSASASSKTGTSSSTISDLFLRATVIILGFIFVAVGLSMFKTGDLNIVTKNADVLKGFKKGLKGRK